MWQQSVFIQQSSGVKLIVCVFAFCTKIKEVLDILNFAMCKGTWRF